MTLVYDFIANYIENFFNSEEFMRNITFGQTLIDHPVQDISLINSGFLGFRLTHCIAKNNYRKCYVYVNTDYLDKDLILLNNLVRFNCRVILLEEGVKCLDTYYIPSNSNIMADKKFKYKFSNSIFCAESVKDLKSFNVSITNSVIYINNLIDLDDIKLLNSIPHLKQNQIKIINIYLYKKQTYAFDKIDANLNRLYETAENLFISNNLYDCQHIEIAYVLDFYNPLRKINKALSLHNDYLSLGHISLKDKKLQLKLFVSQGSLGQYQYNNYSKQEFVLDNTILLNWYDSFNCYFVEDLEHFNYLEDKCVYEIS